MRRARERVGERGVARAIDNTLLCRGRLEQGLFENIQTPVSGAVGGLCRGCLAADLLKFGVEEGC